MTEKIFITVEVSIKANVQKVWQCWTLPEHIVRWYFASDDWHAPKAENDLRAGGSFLTRMESKDGTMGFDFTGIYDEVNTESFITYTITGGRKVKILFSAVSHETHVSQIFEAEDINEIELQRGGWQAILENFKKYVESN